MSNINRYRLLFFQLHYTANCSFDSSTDRTLSDDMTLADVNRMDFHLRQSLQHLVDFFDLEAPNNSSGSSASSQNAATALDDRTLHSTTLANGVAAQTLGPNAPGES